MDTLREILKDINEDITSIKKVEGNKYLRTFMECAYIPERRLPLPDSDPPYKVPTIESDVQTKGVVWQFLKKLDSLHNLNIPALRREVMFIDALENVTYEESLVFLHMKDQTMEELYPNITLDALKGVGYFG